MSELAQVESKKPHSTITPTLSVGENISTVIAAFKPIIEKYPSGPITPELLDKFEAHIFDCIEQGVPGFFELDIPTSHTFTKHSYVREALMPKGSLIIGHSHRDYHHCVVLKGRMTILNPDRTTTEIVAPATFLSGPGRKVGFMHEDVVMQNIHLSEGWPDEMRNDIEKLEDHIYSRTMEFKDHKKFMATQPLKEVAA